MKNSHLSPRQPRTRGVQSITWSRTVSAWPTQWVVTYRLFRRDLAGRMHTEARMFVSGDTRGQIARALWASRKSLREAVDTVDLIHLGLVTPPLSEPLEAFHE